jgi:hypothetical protein
MNQQQLVYFLLQLQWQHASVSVLLMELLWAEAQTATSQLLLALRRLMV